MKRSQTVLEKQYVKAWLKLLTEVAQALRRFIRAVDGYFFDEECADIRPYFYGSISFTLAVTLFLYVAVGE
ncbi:MAG: hypothetical protein RR588_02095 [Solibacillus sp.]